MLHQLRRCFRSSVPLEVSRRAHDCHFQRRRNGHGNHVLIQALPQPNAGIQTLGHDVGKAIVHDQFQPQVWVSFQEFTNVGLGSPVWFYSPAPPLWAFVENNRFDGKDVVLFNTFNSNFGDDQIAAFRLKVMERGAKSFEHRHVLRGRMTQQLTPEEMLHAIDNEWFARGTQP